MKRLIAIILAVITALSLAACENAEHTYDAQTTLSTEAANFKEYPGDTNIPIDDAQTVLPEKIYSTPASENGLDGIVYIIKGVITDSEEMDGATYFVIKTDDGNVAVCDMLDYDIEEVESVDTDSLREYFPLPSVGESVIIAAEYIGFSDRIDLAMFVYGGSEYLSKALVAAAFDSLLETMSQTDTEEPTAEPSPTNPTKEQTPTQSHVATQAEKPTETQTPTVSGPTTGEKNALKSAKNYLNIMAFSYEGLIKQLEYEGYTNTEATYAADNCNADWNAQAVKSAKNYLSVSAFSCSGLIRQLEYEGFTSDQASYGTDHCGADWYEQATKSATNCLNIMSFSRDGLINQLEYEGFTHDQAVHGANSVGL